MRAADDVERERWKGKQLNRRQMFHEAKFRFTKREGKWSTSKKHRWRERERDKASAGWGSARSGKRAWHGQVEKLAHGKSIWEWVRLTLTPNVQPVMSWEESSWQRIRIFETYIHRGSEIHWSTHSIHTNPSMQATLVKCTCNWGDHMHSVLRLYQTCMRALT